MMKKLSQFSLKSSLQMASKEIPTNADPHLAKLKATITRGKIKGVPFIPILTIKEQTGVRVLGDKDGIKWRKAIDVNLNIATLDNEYMDMAVKDDFSLHPVSMKVLSCNCYGTCKSLLLIAFMLLNIN